MAKKISDVVFVNEEKLRRATEIVALLARAPKNDNEIDLKDRFSNIFAEAEMKAGDPGAVRFVYEKLGGLIRSESEQMAAEKRAEEMKRSKKKREKED